MPYSFDEMLARYAELVVNIGLNLRAGQRLVVVAPVEAAPFARQVVAEAYRSGARLVDMMWNDDQVTLARFQYAPRDSFEEYPVYKAEAITDYARSGDAILNIFAEDPDLLKDQDPELIKIAQLTGLKYSKPYLEVITQNGTNWCIASVPIPSWATRVFPDLEPGQAVDKLWETIFEVCRLKQGNPVEVWKEHVRNLKMRGEYLTRKQYRALKYTGPGTELTIGLPEGHVWVSGQLTATNGISYIANLPTEEVFTLPHKDQAEGVVSSSKPLSYGGKLIDDFQLTFEQGRVVDLKAAKGEEILRNLVETDEGARHLGEAALVPHRSPISLSGLMFYNTLFDENAASHLALGRGLHFNIQDGEKLSAEEFETRGGNNSLVHVDFMIGSDRLDVDGVLDGGTTEPVMRQGEWAFALNE